MEKIWIFTQESNVDGEITFNVIPCASEEAAKKVFEEEKNWILNDSYHFGQNMTKEEREEECGIEESEKQGEWYRFFIQDYSDDYYEELYVEEKIIRF